MHRTVLGSFSKEIALNRLANKILCDNETTNFNFPIMQREVGNIESRI